MASALFQQYENDYCAKATDVSRKLQGLAPLPAGVQRGTCESLCVVGASRSCMGFHTEQRRAKLREIDHEIKDAERVVRGVFAFPSGPGILYTPQLHTYTSGATHGHGGAQQQW